MLPSMLVDIQGDERADENLGFLFIRIYPESPLLQLNARVAIIYMKGNY